MQALKKGGEVPSSSAQLALWRDLEERCLGERAILGGLICGAGSIVQQWVARWRRPITEALGGGTQVTAVGLDALDALKDRDEAPGIPLRHSARPALLAMLSRWLATFASSANP